MNSPKLEREIQKAFARQCPQTFAAICGRRYALPSDRQADYYSQRDLDESFLFDFLMTATRQDGFDKVAPEVRLTKICRFGALGMAIRYNRPTLFLERELGEALARTSLPPDLQTSDIHWRWPVFRVVLPRGLVSNPDASFAYLDLAKCPGPDSGRVPEPFASETEKFIISNASDLPPARIAVPEFAFSIGTLRSPESFISITSAIAEWSLAQVWGWEDRKLQEIAATPCTIIESSDPDAPDPNGQLQLRLNHLALNILIFLGSIPVEYEPPTVIRAPRLEGKHRKSALTPARFVGQLAYRPASRQGPAAPPTGRKVAAHWVCGHWHRICYGPKHSLRRLQWFQPYPTHGPDEETA